MNRYQSIDYLDYQIKRNHNELLKLQIEHLKIHNDILKQLSVMQIQASKQTSAEPQKNPQKQREHLKN